MKPETVTGNEAREARSCHSKSPNARVERFRNKLREQDCGRLDVWIGGAWVRGLVFLAQHQKRPLWAVVQEAVKSHITKIGLVYKEPPKDRSR